MTLLAGSTAVIVGSETSPAPNAPVERVDAPYPRVELPLTGVLVELELEGCAGDCEPDADGRGGVSAVVPSGIFIPQLTQYPSSPYDPVQPGV